MDDVSGTERIQRAGARAWRLTVLSISALLVVVLFAGMAYLVYRNELSEGPLVLFAGVILGYLLRLVQDYV